MIITKAVFCCSLCLFVAGRAEERPPSDGTEQAATVIRGLVWLDRAVPYPDPTPAEDKAGLGDTYKIWFAGAGPAKRGDTFPMTWADDRAIYTSSGDPHWGRKATGLDVEKISGLPPGYYISKVNEMEDYVGRTPRRRMEASCSSTKRHQKEVNVPFSANTCGKGVPGLAGEVPWQHPLQFPPSVIEELRWME